MNVAELIELNAHVIRHHFMEGGQGRAKFRDWEAILKWHLLSLGHKTKTQNKNNNLFCVFHFYDNMITDFTYFI